MLALVCAYGYIIYEKTALTCLPARRCRVFVYFQIIKTKCDKESNERKRDEGAERGRQPSAIAYKQNKTKPRAHDVDDVNVNAAMIQKLNARRDRPVEMSCVIQLKHTHSSIHPLHIHSYD